MTPNERLRLANKLRTMTSCAALTDAEHKAVIGDWAFERILDERNCCVCCGEMGGRHAVHCGHYEQNTEGYLYDENEYFGF